MCGIVGVISAWSNGFTSKELDMFRDMLFVDTMRGWDSTGVFGVDKHGNVQLHKEASMGPVFIKSKEYDDFRNELFRTGRFVVGHNRAATRGSVNDKNAHPFAVDDKVVLVQNGTYNGSHKHLKDVEVDTEAIAHVLCEEPDIAKALQKVDAAYALVWYNVDDKKLHIIRNTQRPLYVATTKDGAFVFASEAETILYGATHNQVELNKAPYLLKDYCLATFTLTKESWEVEYQEIDARYKRPPYSANQQHYAAAWENEWEGYMVERARSAGFENACAYNDHPDTNHGMGTFTPTNTRHPFSSLNEPRNRIRISISEALLGYGGTDTYTVEEAQEMGKMYPVGSEITVETLDYIHGNEDRDCGIFFIIARPVTTDDNDFSPYVYWSISDVEESDALREASGKFYKVKLGSFGTRSLQDENKVQRVVCFSPAQPGSREEIVLDEKKENTNVVH